jgi:hypothetical protein
MHKMKFWSFSDLVRYAIRNNLRRTVKVHPKIPVFISR